MRDEYYPNEEKLCSVLPSAVPGASQVCGSTHSQGWTSARITLSRPGCVNDASGVAGGSFRARANAAMFTCDDCSSEEEKTKAEAPYAGHVEPPKKPITETAAWKDHLPDQP